ncbi:MurR/RpiR family transcriptional regulator [Alteribacillus sp. YIM 98480]|uniref:MurR/RpiR family transcriptional regulator n=1 Tax=Alteribacillus sp. YIM 98480 TaxID=2606599 RepID=UPI00131DD973|nr:MurR/RpiR family transcriptional regulator [Alteribacillus sp. YIM 98480]
MGSIIGHIQVNYPKLSKMEKRIADYIMEHKEDLLNIHIGELAENIGVSEATITRFSRKVGCKNFVELKILLRDVVERHSETTGIIGSVDDIYDTVLQSTRQVLDEKALQIAVSWLEKANSIHIYGIESSGLSAEEMKKRMLRMGYKVDAHTDSHVMLINSSILGSEDVILAISNSGETREVIDACQLGKKQGAKVISITNHDQTPLSKTSDILLFTSNLKIHEAKGLINSQLSMIYVLDILSMMLVQNEQAAKHYKKTVNALNHYKKI